MNELALQSAPAPPALSGSDVVDAFLAGRNPRTMEAYWFDLTDFGRFVGARTTASAVDALLAMGHGGANRVALAYRADLVARKLASATIARRLAALRSMVRLARQIGRIEWALDIESPRSQPYRDTSGPGHAGWLKMRSKARTLATNPIGKRDAALVAILHDCALRRGECVAMDLADVELDRKRVGIVGKGCTERQWITLPTQACAALAEWIGARGDAPGPLFCRLDRAGRGIGRLTGESVNRLVRRLGGRAELRQRVRAHGLRHQAVTRVLDVTGGDIRAAQKFARHSDPKTTMRYDDNRRDDAGRLAQMLADDPEEV